MTWNLLGLLFEFLFLAAGVYLYLFAIGRLNFRSAENQKKAEAFRGQNGGLIRILALAMMAIAVANIFFSIQDLMK